MTVQRVDPPFVADERTMLVAWLDYHRATLAMKCDGLTDDQLRIRSAEPSSMSLLGLVRHMADVERNWARRVVEGEDTPPLFWSRARPDGDFDDVDDADVDEAFAAWRAECSHADAVYGRRSLDDLGRSNDDRPPPSLRWVLIHLIEEYARHNGHADLLRERIDGAVGD